MGRVRVVLRAILILAAWLPLRRPWQRPKEWLDSEVGAKAKGRLKASDGSCRAIGFAKPKEKEEDDADATTLHGGLNASVAARCGHNVNLLWAKVKTMGRGEQKVGDKAARPKDQWVPTATGHCCHGEWERAPTQEIQTLAERQKLEPTGVLGATNAKGSCEQRTGLALYSVAASRAERLRGGQSMVGLCGRS